MFERYTERARRVIFFARYEASQLGQQLHRDRAPPPGPDPRGQGPDLAHLLQEPPVHGVDPQGDRGPRPLPRQGLDLGGHPALARRASACSATPPRKRSGCSTTTSAPSTSCSGLMREEKSVAAGILGREGDAPHRGARGHRPAPEREGERRQDQGDAAPLRVLARPDRGRGARRARPAGRARRGAGPHHPGPLPPHPQQPGAHRRAGGGQDGARRGPGQQDRAGRRAGLPGREAHPGPRHLADRGRHQVPRAVRGAAEDDHAGAHREPQHHHLHRRAAHAGRARARPRARSTPPTS